MSESSAIDIQVEVARLQHVLEDTLERSANSNESDRTDALADAMRESLVTLSAETRTAVLDALDAQYADASSTAADRRLRDLEIENARLREELAARPSRGGSGGNDGLGTALVQVLLGDSRSVTQLDVDAERRMIEVTRVLVAFVSELVRSYLGATLDPDRTMAGRLGAVLADEVRGTVAPGSVAAVIAQIRQQIGGQILAFREACDIGTRDLLRQLAPAALAAGSAHGVRLLGARPFYYRECWENFEKKYEELRTADNLYEAYFDGAFRKALHRVSRTGDRPKGGK